MTAEYEPCWFYIVKGRRKGPVLAEDLVSLLVDGELPPDVRCWRPGLNGWVAANRFPELRILAGGALQAPEAAPGAATVRRHRLASPAGSSDTHFVARYWWVAALALVVGSLVWGLLFALDRRL